MQRWLTTLVGLVVVVLVMLLVARNFHSPAPVGRDPNRAGLRGNDDGGGLMFAYGDGAAFADDGGPLLLADLIAMEPSLDAGVGGTMPDGTPVPPLPMSVPRQVRFGVVLVSYAAAQPSAGSGHPSTRSKSDARTLAARLLATARQDFHAGVQQGDPGSSDDVGRVKLGILEPAPEYVLFTLAVDGVAGPVDTPRGYWIVKRLE
jgi:hypothetical protein